MTEQWAQTVGWAKLVSSLDLGEETDWPPAVLADSAWLEHVPFAHWLVKTLHPAHIVELGTYTGVSYGAFCGSVARLGYATRCHAIDTWMGDDHSGYYSDDVYTAINAINSAEWGAFSTLLRMTFSEARDQFASGEIDLLHIDGLHTYEVVQADWERWRDTLSDRGVVLFHDTNVRERNFGVWRLFDQLKAQYRHFEFLHGYGLGVLGVGTDLPSPISALFGASANSGATARIQSYFAARGAAVRDRYLLREITRRAESADSALLAASCRNERVERELSDAKRRANSAETALLLASKRSTESVAALSKTKTELSSLRKSRSWALTRPLRAVSRLARGDKMAVDWLRRKVRLSRSSASGTVSKTKPSRNSAHPRTASSSRPLVVWIGGEADTPGYIYRVKRYVAAACAAGYDACAMRLSEAQAKLTTIEKAEAVIIWRAAWDQQVAQVIAAARRGGARVVFDCDDLMVDPDLACLDVIDGIRSQNLTEKQVREYYSRIQRTMQAADLCTATTKELAGHMRRYGKAALVLPNGFDDTVFRASRLAFRRRMEMPKDDLLRIGYAGGTRTHQRDFGLCVAAVARILRERPKARLVLFRDAKYDKKLIKNEEFPVLFGLEDRIEWRDLVPLAELPNEIARFDINLSPLEVGNVYCEAKSELKFFEAALAGVCTVASPTGPLRRAIRDGETGILVEGEDAWHDAIERLLDDASLRASMAKAALRDVLWTFGPERRTELTASLLEQVLEGRKAARAFALDLARQRERASVPPPIPETEVRFKQDALGTADVSVIIPLYNYENYIEEALDSVRAQTLSDIDLVVVDDVSTDRSLDVTLDWVRRHASRFNRLLVLQNRVNSGLAMTRNAGFDAVETPYVLPLDADNRLLPECAEACLTQIRKSAAAFAYPVIRQFGDSANLMGNEPYDPAKLVGGNYIDAMALVAVSAWSLVGGYAHINYGWEDYEFWCRIAERGLIGTPVPGRPLAEYRVHHASMLRTQTHRGNNIDGVIAEIEGRHPWVSVTVAPHVQPEPQGNEPAFVPDLARLLPLLRCPETGAPLEADGEDWLRTTDGAWRWPVVQGRPVMFPGMPTPEIRPYSHVSNQLPEELLTRMRAEPGHVLNLSAGGSLDKPANVIEVETAIFRNTDLIADAHRLPFADASFHAVVALNAFEHYSEPRQAALEILRVLKPGGWVVIRTAFLQPEHEAPWHFYNCTRQGLLRWFEGFEDSNISVPDNMDPAHALSWLASEAEETLRRHISPAAAAAFANSTIKELAACWHNPVARNHPVWSGFAGLSQENRMSIAAGFEYFGRKSTKTSEH